MFSFTMLEFLVPCCDFCNNNEKRCSVRLYLQLFVAGLMSCSCYLCLFTYSGVQHILCCVFGFVCLCLMLPVSLDFPFFSLLFSLTFIYPNITIFLCYNTETHQTHEKRFLGLSLISVTSSDTENIQKVILYAVLLIFTKLQNIKVCNY